MYFAAITAALLAATTALAQTTHNVTVGGASPLAYTPSQLTGVSAGDVINFIFAAGNHTVTQSSFANPCTSVANATNSGFKPFVNGSAPPVFQFTVPSNLTAPLWFFCAQTVPGNHCRAGMVFAINPTQNQTFSAFQSAAMASGTATSTASGSASSSSTQSGSASSSPSSASVSNTAPASPPPSSTPTAPLTAPTSGASTASNSAPPSSSTGSTNTSASDTGATSPSPTNGAMNAKVGAASVLLSGVGFLAALLL